MIRMFVSGLAAVVVIAAGTPWQAAREAAAAWENYRLWVPVEWDATRRRVRRRRR